MRSLGPKSLIALDLNAPGGHRGPREAAHCVYCGKTLSLLTRMFGDKRFCSLEHREMYRHDADQLGMEALAWFQASRLEARVRPARSAAKKRATLAGFTAPPRRLEGAAPDPGLGLRHVAPQPVQRVDFSFRSVAAPLLDAALVAFPPLARALGRAPGAERAADEQLALRGNCLPLGLRPQAAELPLHGFVPEQRDLVPESAPYVESSYDVTRIPMKGAADPRFPADTWAAESALDGLQPAGVSDDDARSAAPVSLPPVIGDPVPVQPGEAAGTAAMRSPRLHRIADRDHGVFIPQVHMGTLHPRMAFGPLPPGSAATAKHRVIPFEARPGQRAGGGEKQRKTNQG